MAKCRRFNSVYSSRYVYNSKHVDLKLFDVEHVRKMLVMYRHTKPNMLFSDVVKKKPVSKAIKIFVNTTSVKSKIDKSKSTGQSGNHNIVRTCVDKHRNTVVKRQNVGHSKCIENYNDSIVNMCHANRFAVLQSSDSDSVDSNEIISTVVEDVCNTDCQSSGTVKTENGKQGRQEGKKILNVNTVNCQKRVLDSNANAKNNHRIHPQTLNRSQNETVDPSTSSGVGTGEMGEGDKYALEINTALKCEKIRLAKESTANKRFLNQNQPLFGFIPIYGLKSRIYDSNSNTVCKDILSLHERLQTTDEPNYRGLQVPVHSKLNYEKWSQYLAEY